METGAEIDMVTLRPRGEAMEQKEQAQEAAEKERAETQAGFINVINSPEGNYFTELIAEKLELRIENLIAGDPEASSYIKLLQELGSKMILAKRATKKIIDKQLKRE